MSQRTNMTLPLVFVPFVSWCFKNDRGLRSSSHLVE